MVYSGTPDKQNFGTIYLKNEAADTYLRLAVRCGRESPKKGEGAVSARVTNNGVNSGKGRKADGTFAENIRAVVPGTDMTVTLDPQTGKVTINGADKDASWGDTSFGTTVNMTVTGSGTSVVTIKYVIKGNLTGGTAQSGEQMLPATTTMTLIYTATPK